MVITIPALVGPRIGPDMCVRAPPPPLQRGTTKTDKQWTPRHSRWQCFDKHDRLAPRESQVLNASLTMGLAPVTKLHNYNPYIPFPLPAATRIPYLCVQQLVIIVAPGREGPRKRRPA